jgi:hypothetical protein
MLDRKWIEEFLRLQKFYTDKYTKWGMERSKRSLNCTKAHRLIELKRIVHMHNGDTDYNDLVSYYDYIQISVIIMHGNNR